MDPHPTSRAATALWHAPYLLLALAILFWSGNFVIGRAVHALVPPISLAFWRWTGGFLVVIPFAWPHVVRDWSVARRHWRILLLLSALGVSVFNTLVYIGLGSTTAVNGVLMQSSMPLMIMAASFLLFGDRIGLRQLAGLALSLAGVGAIVTRGHPEALLALRLNPGDAWILVAVTTYALYSSLLRRKPAMHPLSFLAVTFAIGALLLVPFYAAELWSGAMLQAQPATFLAIAYVAVFPSVLAYIAFNRGVELIGANRAGPLFHLMPAFGSVLAVLFLGESIELFHLAGIALIAGGLVLAARRTR